MTSQAQNKYLIKVNGAGGGSGGSTNAIDTLKRVSDSIYGRVAGGFKFQFKDTIPPLQSVLTKGNSSNKSIFLLDTIDSESGIYKQGLLLDKTTSIPKIGLFTGALTGTKTDSQYVLKQDASTKNGYIYLPLQNTQNKKDTLAKVSQLNLYVTRTDSQYLYKQDESIRNGQVYLPLQTTTGKKDTLATLSDVRGGYKKYVAQIIDTGGTFKISVKENTLDSIITIDTIPFNSQGIIYRINGHNSSLNPNNCIILLGTGVRTNTYTKTYVIEYSFINSNLIYIVPWELGTGNPTPIRSGIMNISVEIRYYP
jgi:hypothetical protein